MNKVILVTLGPNDVDEFFQNNEKIIIYCRLKLLLI